MNALKPLLATIATARRCLAPRPRPPSTSLLAGEATSAQMGAFLMGLRVRGETVAEITGAVAAMRGRMLRVAAPAGAIDIVGTGGDGHGTYNVSTLAAIITAACGVPVAKHGNRAASSRSGASDVLSALGVAVGGSVADIERCLAESGIGFMSAQAHHAAMRHFAAVRADLGVRTLFNILGPLSNPAGTARLLVGVFAAQWLEPLAEVLGALGAERAWLVHGSDGLDEITTTGPDRRRRLGTRRAHPFYDPTGGPRDCERHIGRPARRRSQAECGGAAAVLNGARNAYRDIAVLNAAAALVVAERVDDISTGVGLAQTAVDNGAAALVLERLVRASNSGLRAAAMAP